MSETGVPIQENAAVAGAEAAPERLSRWQVAWRALRHRNFQLFFSGQLISLIGTWMQSVAQSWLVYRMTGSALLLGSVGFASQVPVFLFAPLGGIAADRFDRRHIVIATQTASMLLAFVLAALTLLHKVQVWHVFVLASLLGVVNAFDIPGRQSFLVDMVGKEDLMNAIALNSSMFNGARVIGPAIAGILVAKIGEGWCFFANAVSYIAVIIGLLLMRVIAPLRAAMASPLEHMMEGFRFVNRTAPIRALLLLLGLVSLVGMPYVVLMPIFADQILHGGARGLGILMGATGVGALLGALTLAFREGVKGLGRWVAWCCAGFGASLIIFALSRTFWVSVILLLPVGYCMMLQMACSNTLIQVMVPDALRGRVMAVYSMMFMGMAPIGALFGGALAERLGAPYTVAIGGLAS
ncbi:MAG: MFS transporter, partial [Candidatus Sulfotelmatobacter sp.]